MKLVSIIIPVYNEEAMLSLLYKRICTVIDSVSNYQFELLFVNDGSRDRSMEMIRALKEQDNRVAYINLSRNFGKEIAMAAAFQYVRGDGVVIMDADLQDPPELIIDMIAEWEKGYDDVYAKRVSRDGESFLKKATSHLYYRILKQCTRVPIQEDTGDFRLLSRRAVEALKRFGETQRYTKGLFSWIGFHKKELLFHRDARAAGTTKWNYLRLVDLALEGITSFTTAPLRFASFLGLGVFSLSMLFMCYILGKTLIYGDPVAGYPSLMVVILFLGGCQLLSIGIIGEYLGRVFNETKQRPLFFIDEYSEEKDR